MLHRARSKDKGSAIPGPTYMSKEQVGSYLRDIRSNRPARPVAPRPLPATSLRDKSNPSPVPNSSSLQPARCQSALSHRDMSLNSATRRNPFHRAASSLGRPLARDPKDDAARNSYIEPDPAKIERASSAMSVRSSRSTAEKASYRESGMRWMERQEAHSLRRALEDMDEQKVYDDARDEAAELVWKHQNPNAPYPYTAHLRKGSHARAQSYDTASHHSSGDSRISSGGSKSSSAESQKVPEPESKPEPPPGPKKSYGSISKGHVSFNIPPPARRRTSSGSRRKASGSLFKNPNDKIYEEPEEASSKPDEKPSKLPTHTRRNPFSRARDNLGRSNTEPPMNTERKLWDRFEIHRNPPSQSRNAGYTSNEASPAATPPPKSENDAPAEEQTDGKEIRGDDIRAATSMRLKDRSSKLPTPSMVSDSPGRPIVSFQKDYKPKEIELKEGKLPEPVEPKAYPPSPTKSSSAPVVPTINVPDVPFSKSIPTINVPDESPIPTINLPEVGEDKPAQRPLPTINLPDDSPSTPVINVINVTEDKPAQRPLPTINAPSTSRPLPDPATAKGRPLPRHANTAPVHRTPTSVRTTALCEACAQPIAGRIVSAAGARFHPECFLCYHCGEALECVAFYPEPDVKRAERLERIEARTSGYDMPVEWPTAEEDGDAGLRFYCHLDYHEMFSPRCKSCKTPIEGEVVVACGAEWHVGHFFCAQCGDPFDSSTPFVEKDGYAWCVDCHTNRYSTKCKKCRKPVTDTVLKALGAEWHPDCFVCTECSASFDDGRYFLRGATKDPVCVRCEERRLKA
ncbi:LIM domain protein [Phyllosticta citriasiana]|uniref:LIM domain protein n=1 Tax=Phyllosticta citriasiana TaxID=595635 RepID=UPI0030FD538F